MKQPIENSLPMAKAAKRLGFRSLGVLLVIALLGLVPLRRKPSASSS